MNYLIGDHSGTAAGDQLPDVHSMGRGTFIAWAVGSSRNRDNWKLTTVKHLCNVLRLITELANGGLRDVTSLGNRVFAGCAHLPNARPSIGGASLLSRIS